jgi:hypothetical protein
MISILNELAKIEATRKYVRRLDPTLNQVEVESLASLAANQRYPKNYSTSCLSFTKGFETQKYLAKYARIRFSCDLIQAGLGREDSRIKDSFNYLSVLENHARVKAQLEEKLYESLKNRNSTYKYLNRINYFESFKISRNDTLKHPGLIAYYYSKDSICSTEYNKISLPDMQKVVRKAGEVSICVEDSSKGFSRDPVSNIRSGLTSHQYIVKDQNKGKKYLTYILDYKREITLNRLSIADASIFEANINEIYYYKNNIKVFIDYSLIRSSYKKLALFSNKIKARRFYIKFSQINYLDLEQEQLSTKEKIINGNSSSFSQEKDAENYYYYEFNIDSIEGSYALKKKSGIFKLEESIPLEGLSSIKVNVRGLNLDKVDYSIYLKQKLDSQETVSIITSDGASVNSKYDIGELIFTINGKEEAEYENFYIDSIDIKGS